MSPAANSPEALAPTHQWAQELEIDRVAVSSLLKELGFHLDTDLAPSMMLAAQDMLMSIELASSLPDGADFLAACSILHTVSLPQPEAVQLVQQAVARNYLASLDGLARTRMDELLRKLDL